MSGSGADPPEYGAVGSRENPVGIVGPFRRFRGEVRCHNGREVTGYIVDPDELSRRFVVELFLDDAPVALARAELFEPTLCDQGLSDGCYGFAFAVPDHPGFAAQASVFIANSDHQVGAAVSLTELRRPARDDGGRRSEVRWIGGLKFIGWVEPELPERPAEISVFVDGECVARVNADRWTPRGDFPIVDAAQRFEVTLPERFADGRLRRAHFFSAEGGELRPGPCEFVAFADGLERFLQERAPLDSEALRGRLYDRLIPQSIPFEEFESWRLRFPSRPLSPGSQTRVAIALIGDDELDASLASLETQQGCEWVAASVFDAGGGREFDPEDIRRFLSGEASDCDLVVLARSGSTFDPRALGLLAQALIDEPAAPAAYSDIAIRSSDGSTWPLAFPAFDYERMLEQGYAASFFAIRKSCLLAALDDGARDVYRLFNSCLDSVRSVLSMPDGAVPVHVPGFLATVAVSDVGADAERLATAAREHCAAVGRDASVTPIRRATFPAVCVRRARGERSLSVAVAARGGREQISRCVSAVTKGANRDEIEIFIVGGRDALDEARDLDAGVQRLCIQGLADLPHCANAIMTTASGEYLLFLDPQWGVPTSDSLDELLCRMAEPDAGAAAPVVVRPDRGVHSAGHVLGVRFGVAGGLEDRSALATGYGDLLAAAHEVSSVGAAGMMTRRDLFREMCGFDVVQFRRAFADVDYCLRLRARGFRIVVAPQARIGNGNIDRLMADSVFQSPQCERDLASLRTRWGEALLNDPFYNPCLSLDATYSALAWPPRSTEPRSPAIGAARPAPPGM